MKALVTAIRYDHRVAAHSRGAAASHGSDLSHLADIWWGDSHAAGIARRKAQGRFVLTVAALAVTIASVASIAAEPNSAPRAVASPATPPPVAAPVVTLPATIPPPLDYAVEMTVELASGNGLEALLVKADAAPNEARVAAELVRDDSSPVGRGPISIFLGDRNSSGSRTIEQIAMRPSLDRQVAVTRDASGALKLVVREIAIDGTPMRIAGTVGSGLFWSLRSAGATPELAEDYLSALAANGATAAPGDRFELVVDRRRAATGEIEQGALQYAGLDRARRGDVRLLLWTIDGRRIWVDPDQPMVSASTLALPLGGTISSPFGVRNHPIFRTARFHRGVDIRAAWGTPVHASADGQVTRSGWSGGYGLRVRLAHRDGLATTYSHLSRIAAPIGTRVHRGELIGFVGSTGFSTGAHLHFELFRGGEAVNPLGARLTSRVALAPTDRAALAARLDQLRSIPAA